MNRTHADCQRGVTEACALEICWQREGKGLRCESNRDPDACIEASVIFELAGHRERARAYCERACHLGMQGACELLARTDRCY